MKHVDIRGEGDGTASVTDWGGARWWDGEIRFDLSASRRVGHWLSHNGPHTETDTGRAVLVWLSHSLDIETSSLSLRRDERCGDEYWRIDRQV